MRKFSALAIVVLTVFLMLPPAAAQGQVDESPASGEAPCKAGELCGSSDVKEPFGSSSQDVQDPPGRYVRSLSTMGLIAVLVGTYLFIALSGRSLFRRRLGDSPRGD